MKYCARCAEIKPIADFGGNRADPSGRATYCKPCHNKVMAAIKAKKHGSVRGYHFERRYGMTEAEVERAVEEQRGICRICLHRGSLHVDHDHASGDVRGLLCFRCNGGLGQFKDDPRVMRRAVDYLEGRLVEKVRPEPRTRAPRGERRSRRHYRLAERYGIGERDVERMIAGQDGLCPICRDAAPFAVDHDHVTGGVRGVLCGDCNTGMGQLRDDPWVLRRAIGYLTGGLFGLSRTGGGDYDVTVVRPRRDGPAVDPGWDIGQIGAHDYAVLHALAHDDSGQPGESDLGVADPGPAELRFPPLDLSTPSSDDPAPAEPFGPAEVDVFA